MKIFMNHWISQRITSILLIPLVIWFLFAFSMLFDFDAATIQNNLTFLNCSASVFIEDPLNSVFNFNILILLLIVLYLHVYEGVISILQDYVHYSNTKLLSIILFRLFLIQTIKSIYFYFIFIL
jgi:succinate dehydrogenase hydrophobic anchor subunit